MKETSFK